MVGVTVAVSMSVRVAMIEQAFFVYVLLLLVALVGPGVTLFLIGDLKVKFKFRIYFEKENEFKWNIQP